jgi:hypothetical protein
MKVFFALVATIAPIAAFLPAFSRRQGFVLNVAGTNEFTAAEKDRVIENVFECYGYFPDMRDESELPADVRSMRAQPKAPGELAEIKAKYNAIKDESERAFRILVDLGMMEDYDKLGDYSDDFDDYAM